MRSREFGSVREQICAQEREDTMNILKKLLLKALVTTRTIPEQWFEDGFGTVCGVVLHDGRTFSATLSCGKIEIRENETLIGICAE